MLGPDKERDLDRPILVSLERLIPPDHFYRHLDATLDLTFIRTWVADLYAPVGRPSIDPVVFFKLQLLMFFEGIRSERQLMETASLNLAHRWYLGYRLDESLPDHSSLTRIRQRLGLPIFRRFFERVVELCQEAGLVWGKELYVDATKVKANASLDSLQPRFAVEWHLAELFSKEEADLPADDVEPLEQVQQELAEDGAQDLADENAARHDWVAEEGRPDRTVIRGHYRRRSDYQASATDPDASLMATRFRGKDLGYHNHYVVDGGKARIILNVLITPAEVMENQPMLDLLWRTCFRWRLYPRHVTGDTTYGTLENIVGLEDMGIKAYLPLPDFDQRTPSFGERDFRYDPARDAYICPAGQLLPRYMRRERTRLTYYRAAAVTCHACSLKGRCTPGEGGRQVQRSFDEAYLERVRAYHQTEPYQRAMRKRRVWVEPLFAEAKQWHGLRRFRLRRLWRVNSEGLLIAAGQNLKRLLRPRGHRHRPASGMAAPPGDAGRSSHRLFCWSPS
jgi:transposase